MGADPGRIVDLSQPITSGMPVYPGDPPVRVEPAATVAADGVMVSGLHLGTHTGTHVDAPRHVLDGGAGIDEIPLDRLHGPARVVDVRQVRPRQRVLVSDVADQMVGLGGDASTSVRPIRIVLVHTGWSRRLGSPRYLEHPWLDVGIAEHLLALGVRTVGVDTSSPDPVGPGAGPARLPFHQAFLGGGGVIVENLTNLSAVSWPDPVFSALPLPLAGLDGSPVRAVAFRP